MITYSDRYCLFLSMFWASSLYFFLSWALALIYPLHCIIIVLGVVTIILFLTKKDAKKVTKKAIQYVNHLQPLLANVSYKMWIIIFFLFCWVPRWHGSWTQLLEIETRSPPYCVMPMPLNCQGIGSYIIFYFLGRSIHNILSWRGHSNIYIYK